MGTESRILQHLSNLDEVAHRVETAANAGCFIEVISLRLQVMDFWLRIYFYNVLSNSEIREREFGRLLKQTFRLGLDKRLYDKLVAFNKSRVSANHGFFIGAVSYETIGGVATDADSLLRQTVEFVVRSSGKAVASRNDLVANPGAMSSMSKGSVPTYEMGSVTNWFRRQFSAVPLATRPQSGAAQHNPVRRRLPMPAVRGRRR